MSAVYPSAKTALLRGQLDLLVDTVKAVMVEDHPFNPVDAVFTDLTDTLGSPVQVSVANVADGIAIANDVTFNAVANGATVKGLVVYRDSGTPGTSELIAHLDRRADSTILGVATNGGSITFSFTNYLIKL